MDLDFDSRHISALFERLDQDGNSMLDREEFQVFLKEYTEIAEIELDDLAFVLAGENEVKSQEANKAPENPSPQNVSISPNLFFFLKSFHRPSFNIRSK
jgi:hypothetical protein